MNVGVWDSGVDVAVIPTQLFTDPVPTTSGSHGIAVDVANPYETRSVALLRAGAR